jgi:hypothetical protein
MTSGLSSEWNDETKVFKFSYKSDVDPLLIKVVFNTRAAEFNDFKNLQEFIEYLIKEVEYSTSERIYCNLDKARTSAMEKI